VRKKRPELWKKKSWILHQDNAPAHNALAVKQFLADKCISVLEHPPNSPDFAPCDCYLFPKLKLALKGIHFQSVDELMTCSTALNNGKLVCSVE
jgi:transposase